MSEASLQTTTTTTPNPGMSLTDGGTVGSQDSWVSSLPEDIRNEPTFSKFKDVGSLAKSYLGIQKMVGADKVVIPKADAPEEEWTNFYRKAGLPEDPSKYEVKKHDGFDDKIFSGFKEAAFKAGILPKQAEKLLGWYGETAKQAMQQRQMASEQEIEQGLNSLFEEWGEKKDQNIAQAKAAVKHYGGKEFSEFLDKTGLNRHPMMVKLMHKLGTTLSEDKLAGDGQGQLGLSKTQIQGEINQIFANPAYFNKNHPEHQGLVDRMLELNEALNA